MQLKAGDLSAADLEYNRQGMLAPVQSRRLIADTRQSLGTTAVVVSVMIVTVFLLTAQSMSHDPLGAMIVIPIGLVVGTAVIALSGAFRAFRRAMYDVAYGQIECFASPVILTIEHSETKSGHTTTHLVLAGERHFVIDETLYDRLSGGMRYMLYIAPHSKQLVALEPEEDYLVATAIRERHADELTLGEDGELALAEDHGSPAQETVFSRK